jgi:hypothetical protein
VAYCRRAVNILITIHIAWTVAGTISHVLVCKPLSVIWDGPVSLMTNIDKCIHYPTQFLGIMGSELVMNVAVMTLPIREIFKLKKDLQTRLMLTCVFLLGGV